MALIYKGIIGHKSANNAWGNGYPYKYAAKPTITTKMGAYTISGLSVEHTNIFGNTPSYSNNWKYSAGCFELRSDGKLYMKGNMTGLTTSEFVIKTSQLANSSQTLTNVSYTLTYIPEMNATRVDMGSVGSNQAYIWFGFYKSDATAATNSAWSLLYQSHLIPSGYGYGTWKENTWYASTTETKVNGSDTVQNRLLHEVESGSWN